MGRQKSHGRPAGRDYLYNLRAMGKPSVIKLSEHNGHTCEWMPTCRKPAGWCLVFPAMSVFLCDEMYRIYESKVSK